MTRQGSELHVLDDADQLAAAVAEWLCAEASEGEDAFRICLSGGSTPGRLYALLAQPQFRARLPWRRLHWFWGDERFVPPDHADSNYRMARAALLDHAPIPPGNIHPIRTEGRGPAQAAEDYERLLKQIYGADRLDPARPLFHVTLLGLGADGHTASLLPGNPALEAAQSWVAPVEHGRPERRITLTFPALNSSRAAAFLIEGAGKRPVLHRVWDDDRDLPATRIRPVGALHWFVDRAAAGDRVRAGAESRGRQAPGEAVALVVMGVSGSGKTTIAMRLAERLNWPFQDADGLHSPSNIEKMRSGVALTDLDRAPWLRAISARIGEWLDAGECGIVACSALKRAYRRVIADRRPNVRFVYLKGDIDLIGRRIAGRSGHFMPPALLRSQFETLEEPGPEENPIVVSVDATPDEIVDRIVAQLPAWHSAHPGRFAPGRPDDG